MVNPTHLSFFLDKFHVCVRSKGLTAGAWLQVIEFLISENEITAFSAVAEHADVSVAAHYFVVPF